ncbi:MAG: hypothetical protein RL677_943 [Actinomycetota bacterium]|jgi:cytochrome c biogenesis protein CcmG/thiol:disulfide interchange protein DsbE
MKLKVGLILVTSLLLSGCSGESNSKNWADLNQATNYPMQNCPTSDLNAVELKNELPDKVLPCLGHDSAVNLAGLPTGKPMIVSLWASWCVYCEDDAPAFIAAKNKFKNLNFIGINYQDKEDAAIASAAKWKLPFPSVVDSETTLQGFYQISGLPVTLIYDENGMLIGRINGPIGTPEQFTNYLDSLLK